MSRLGRLAQSLVQPITGPATHSEVVKEHIKTLYRELATLEATERLMRTCGFLDGSDQQQPRFRLAVYTAATPAQRAELATLSQRIDEIALRLR